LRALRTIDAGRVVTVYDIESINAAKAFSSAGIGAPLDVVLEDGVVYVETALVEGVSLEHVLAALAERSARIPEPIAIDLVASILRALASVHERPDVGAEPVGHGGISPDCIGVTFETHDAVVSDFGVFCRLTPLLVPRFGYRTPESVGLSAATPASDVFSVGVLAYELLMGRSYYEGCSEEDIEAALRAPFRPVAFDQVPASFAPVLDRALSYRPTDRFPSAKAFLDALESARSERGTRWNGLDREMFTSVMRDFARAFHAMVVSPSVPEDPTGDVLLVTDDEVTALDEADSGSAPTLELPPVVVEPMPATRVEKTQIVVRPLEGPARTIVDDAAPARRRPVALVAAAVVALVAFVVLAQVFVRGSSRANPSIDDAGFALASAPLANSATSHDARPAPALIDAGVAQAAPVALPTTIDAGIVDVAAADDAGSATIDVERLRPAKPVQKPRPRKPTTTKEKLEALKACDPRVPCARPVAAKASSMTSMDLSTLKAFTVELDHCVASCSR
jgi:serine/threonine-protein kinase